MRRRNHRHQHQHYRPPNLLAPLASILAAASKILSRRGGYVVKLTLLVTVGCLGRPSLSFQIQLSQETKHCHVNINSKRPLNKDAYRFQSSRRRDELFLFMAKSQRDANEGDGVDVVSGLNLDPALIKSLDLDQLLHHVAAHCGTRRGRNALLSLVGREDGTEYFWRSPKSQSLASSASARQRRAFGAEQSQQQQQYPTQPRRRTQTFFKASIATNLEQVNQEYDLVKEATEILQQSATTLQTKKSSSSPPSSTTNTKGSTKTLYNYPPWYGIDSSPFDSQNVVESDFTDWLDYREAAEFTLEDILQAEQVVAMLRQVYAWASAANATHSRQKEEIACQIEQAYQLWDIALQIPDDTLQLLFNELENAVEIVRVRSITDPLAKSSYCFRLRASEFPLLQKLRHQEEDLLSRIKDNSSERQSSLLHDQLALLQEQVKLAESEIQYGLAFSILQYRQDIIDAFNIVARLDTLFAKAAFGLRTHARVPLVLNEGCIDVQQFVHPLLQMSGTEAVVPVDLILSANDKCRALIISGMNGGGKTLSLKSFGLAAILVRMGVPIPSKVARSASKGLPRVDFFSFIFVSMGDGQNIEKGQSTFLSQLNFYSQLLQQIGSKEAKKYSLILLDELGSGTEAHAGGAIGQAIIEKILQNDRCRVVATTHSSRLKALSVDSNEIDCATVLPEILTDDDTVQEAIPQTSSVLRRRRPTFKLQYGIIGESLALDAAGRCIPPLPEDVLTRVSELLLGEKAGTESDVSSQYMQAMQKSLERHTFITAEIRKKLESEVAGTRRCLKAILSLAESYDRHLSLLDERIQRCYDELKASGTQPVELVGATLAELRVVKKRVRSQAELLRERGLRPLTDSDLLSNGESVVIIADGEWDGATATVVGEVEKDTRKVLVIPSLQPWDDACGDPTGNPLVFLRYELAVWDYESIWESEDNSGDLRTGASTSISDSKRRLNSVLASLKSSASSTTSPSVPRIKHGETSSRIEFKSSRERKQGKQLIKKRKAKGK